MGTLALVEYSRVIVLMCCTHMVCNCVDMLCYVSMPLRDVPPSVCVLLVMCFTRYCCRTCCGCFLVGDITVSSVHVQKGQGFLSMSLWGKFLTCRGRVI